MAKVVSVRERVHQPFFDTLIRTAGLVTGNLQDKTSLFVNGGARTEATTNLINGSTLPSDQSMVVLALRVFSLFRAPILRVAGGATGEVAENGDYGSLTPFLTGGSSFGQAPARSEDVHRLAYQTSEAIHWSFGTGLKNSLDNVPTWYLPAGGGLVAELGGNSDLVHYNNGLQGHEPALLRLGRAVLLPPRQNILCTASCFAYGDEGQSQIWQTNQGSRNMLSVRDNLNAADGMTKCVSFFLDGLFSRDVQ